MKKIDIFHPLTLNVGLAIHNADWNWQNVTSPFTRIYYVTKGHAKIILPSGEYQLKPGHMYMIPSFTLHSYSCEEHFEHYYIHIYEKLEFESSFMDDYNFPVEIKGEPIDLELVKRLCELNPSMALPKSDPRSYDNDLTLSEYITRNEQRDITLKLESRGILFQLIAKFMKEAKPKEDDIDNRIKKTLIMIQKNLDKNARRKRPARHSPMYGCLIRRIPCTPIAEVATGCVALSGRRSWRISSRTSIPYMRRSSKG